MFHLLLSHSHYHTHALHLEWVETWVEKVKVLTTHLLSKYQLPKNTYFNPKAVPGKPSILLSIPGKPSILLRGLVPCKYTTQNNKWNTSL